MAVAHSFGRLVDSCGRPIEEIGEMDLDDLAMWIAWLNEYGPDSVRDRSDDWRTARVMYAIANAGFGWSGRFSIKDFMPPEEAAPEADIEKQVIAWCVNVGGTVKKESRSNT